MITQETVSFLARTPPFSCIDREVLAGLVKDMSLAFHPRGEVIIRQSGPAAEHLNIIRSGAVRVFVRTNEGEDVLVDSRASGEFFGLRSFLFSDVSYDTIVASEDTTCYQIRKEAVLELLRTNAPFSKFCLRTLLKRLLDMAYREVRDRTLLYGGGDKLLFTNVLGDLATKNVVTASEDISVREAAGIMADHCISSLVLVDERGMPSGMVTDKDLRNKVVSRGRDVEGRVGDIMSVTLIKSEAGDHCFEALVKMMRYNIHHLLVVSRGELRGILTSHDLMLLQGTSPLSIAREIEGRDTIDGLAPVAAKINNIITILIREGAKASTVTRIITEINDRLLQRVLRIIEEKMGRPPAAYCWIAFGSEGRKEQTFRTDQDNAIIYEDLPEIGEEAERYFSEFSRRVQDALARCGFPPCSAGCMASNPTWRQPLDIWKRYFSEWIRTPTPESVLRSLIFFDFRPIYGDLLLAERLRAFLGRELRGKNIFFSNMAGVILRNSPPVDLFGRIKCARRGVHKGRLDIKVNALGPIIDVSRLSALEHQVYHTCTIERLAEVKERCATTGAFSDDLAHAFEFLMSLRLRHQYRQVQEGKGPDNMIDPRGLSTMERTMLGESFKLITRVQNKIMKKYGSSTVT